MPEEGEFEEEETSKRIEKEIEKKMGGMGGIRERRRLLEGKDRQESPEGNVYGKQKMILEKLNEIDEDIKELKEKVSALEERFGKS